jgi:hypothetical protein
MEGVTLHKIGRQRERRSMDEGTAAKSKRAAPWRGRRKVDDPKSKPFPIRFTPGQLEKLSEKASDAGMSIGAFARETLLGSAGPRSVRKPPVQKAELARLLGELGKVGSNVNQLARAFNQHHATPSVQELTGIKSEMVAMRLAIMQALGREP